MPLTSSIRASFAAGALITGGCWLTGASDDPFLTTDRSTYVAAHLGGEGISERFSFVVIARFENRDDRVVYLARCFADSRTPIYGVLAVDATDSQGSAYDGAWGCVGHDRQFAVQPGDFRTDTLHLQGPNSYNGLTHEPYGATTGRVRLYYDVRYCPGDGGCPAPRSFGYSPIFTITKAPE
ncbi:MAG: hypothetical protein HOP28_11950 [Gemmatimonadales bacterium]|nr:hypothetical protein [Gemmatimonadales bacterium]